MKKIILILFCSAAIHSNAQNYLFGIKGGVNANSAFEGRNRNLQPKLGFTGGVTFDFLMKNRFSFGAEISYTERGYRDEVLVTGIGGQPVSEKVGYVNYNYLAVPLKFGYHIGNKAFGFANVGVVPALLVDARSKYPTPFNNGFFKQNLEPYSNKFDLGGLAEIGGGYKLMQEKLWLFASLAYQHSFTSFAEETIYNPKAYHYGLTLSAGVKYAI